MQVIYLVQGARVKLEALRFPPNAIVYALCYDVNFELSSARITIFNADCTWSEGRNLLLLSATETNEAFEYVVFCDDDVEFVAGSFEAFERRLAKTCPLAAIPLMPKARVTASYLPDCSVQRAVAVDEQMVALHYSVLGTRSVAPLESAHDSVSWYVACLLFEYHALHAFGAYFHQYNDIEIVNRTHTWLDGGTHYRQGEASEFMPLVLNIIQALPDYDPEILGAFYPQFLPSPSLAGPGDIRAKLLLRAHDIARRPDIGREISGRPLPSNP